MSLRESLLEAIVKSVSGGKVGTYREIACRGDVSGLESELVNGSHVGGGWQIQARELALPGGGAAPIVQGCLAPRQPLRQRLSFRVAEP